MRKESQSIASFQMLTNKTDTAKLKALGRTLWGRLSKHGRGSCPVFVQIVFLYVAFIFRLFVSCLGRFFFQLFCCDFLLSLFLDVEMFHRCDCRIFIFLILVFFIFVQVGSLVGLNFSVARGISAASPGVIPMPPALAGRFLLDCQGSLLRVCIYLGIE